MQQLHLVGFTADNRGLIFSARKGAKSGGFVVTLDDKLLARVDEMVARREAEEQSQGSSNRPRSSLSPREIQARLRAGRSIAEVAREAGVEEEWVARWAAPIAAEQAQVVERAQELTLEKNRVGLSAVPLGEAVRWNMADKGIVFTDAGWTGSWEAFHLRGNSWMVRFTYAYRRATHQAEWEVDTRDALVTSRNRQGTDLGYVAPGTRRPKMPRSMLAAIDLPSVAPALPAASSGRAVKPGTGAPAKKTAPRPPAKKKTSDSKKVAARTAAAKKQWAAIKKAADRQAAADRLASKKAVAKKAAEAEKRAAAKKAAAKKAAARKPASKKAASKSAPKKAAARKSSPKKTLARKSAARKSNARKAPVKKSASNRPPRPAAKKSTTQRAPAKRRPPAPAVLTPARRERPSAQAPRVSSRPSPSAPPRDTNRPTTRPGQAAAARSARRASRPERSESPAAESRRVRPGEGEERASRAEPAIEREADEPQVGGGATRTPIRIDSGVPRRGESSGPPIIRADRADQSREEPEGVGARSSENGAPRQGRFRFRRARTRS